MESFDRSTTREYGDLSNDISSKYDALKKSENEVVKQENEHYKSILKQVSYKTCLKSPLLLRNSLELIVRVYLHQLNVSPA